MATAAEDTAEVPETKAQEAPQDAKRLTREDVLKASERKREDFYVEELGGTLPLVSLTAWEQHLWQQAMMKFEYGADGKVRGTQTDNSPDLLAFSMGVRNGDDDRWFTYDQVKDLPAGVVKKTAARIRVLSGMDVTVEEAKGN